MITLRFDQLTAITGGTLSGTGAAAKRFAGISIDSRTLAAGELFIAIRGERQDGHRFVESAIDKGAAGVIVERSHSHREDVFRDVAIVAVDNSHDAMLALARNHREELSARFVGITGSNGKTTTKELTFHLLKAAGVSVYRSPGNLNNLFGLPLALFAIPGNTETAIMELGISMKSEMPRLASIARPHLVVITNIGPSHLQFLESVEAVARAKLELVRAVSRDVPVIINADDRILVEEAKAIRSDYVTFALDGEADFRPQSIELNSAGVTTVTIAGRAFRLPLPGRHQVSNLLAAYAAFITLGYSFDDLDTTEIGLQTAPMRGQIVRKKGITFVTDCYNANPDSVKAGLQAFFQVALGTRRVVILGDMLELGQNAIDYHREIGRMLAGYQFDLAALVGPLSEYIMQEALAHGVPEKRLEHFPDAKVCGRWMLDYCREGDFVYVKASRGIGLEVVMSAVAEEEAA